jgi:FtsZ-binding cell division protein ZapB
MAETMGTEQPELLLELDRLEEKVRDITQAVQKLRAEKAELERACESLRSERQVMVRRLSSLIEKVDALRGEV